MTQTAHDYGFFSFDSKEEMLEKSKEFWNPGKTQFWVDSGVPLVIDRREEYFIYDMSGKRLIGSLSVVLPAKGRTSLREAKTLQLLKRTARRIEARLESAVRVKMVGD